MKLHVPQFLRKKMRSASSSSSSSSSDSPSSSSGHSMKNSGSLQAMTSLDSNSTVFSSASTSSSASHGVPSSEGSRQAKGLLQAQKVSTMEEIVVLQETTGKIESQYASKLPSRNPNHELEEAFLRFDVNRDGKISALELGSVLRLLGDNPSDEELLLMVKEVDRDGDGFIDLQEFILLNSASTSSGDEDLRQAFLVFDTDADGKISVEELHHVLSRLGESCTMEDCRHMIRGVDKDGDGFVDFQEFCTMMSLH